MAPEIKVRQIIHGMGYRYRLHRKNLPGKPDLVFPKKKKIIFVHGCFWHQHDSPECKDGRVPMSRIEYWGPKLERNKHRDKENQENLKKLGWEVMVIWECQLKENNYLAKMIRNFLKPNKKRASKIPNGF